MTHLKFLKSRKQFLFAGLITVLSLMCLGDLYAQQIEAPEKRGVTLQIALVLDQAEPIVAFIVTNNSKRDLSIDEVGINSSPIIITKPNGEEMIYVGIGERIGPAPMVKAGQSRIERGNITSILTHNRLFEPGYYRVHWRVTPHESKMSYTSNELLALREKGATVVDPLTGLPRTIGNSDDKEAQNQE